MDALDIFTLALAALVYIGTGSLALAGVAILAVIIIGAIA